MTTITLPPEIEVPLAEAAHDKGITPESLAVESLRQLFPPKPPKRKPAEPQSLYDSLLDYIGKIEGTGEAFSENCGERFTDDLVEKHKASGS